MSHPASDPRREPLPEPLRAAVDQVRNDPVPEAPLHRSVERARRLATAASFRRARFVLAVASLAAVLLLSLTFLQRLVPVAPAPVTGNEVAQRGDKERGAEGRHKLPDDSSDRAEKLRERIRAEVQAERSGRTAEDVTDSRRPDVGKQGSSRYSSGSGSGTGKGQGQGVASPETAPKPRTDPSREATEGRPSTPPSVLPPPGDPVSSGGPPPGRPVRPVRGDESEESRKYLKSLEQAARRAPGSVSPDELETARKKLRIFERGGKGSGDDETRAEDKAIAERGGEKDKNKGKQDKGEPKVWKRDGRRPTFARVYVGDGNALELVSLHVTVTVEGPRARTLVDHVFKNPHDRQLEGTFEYPLPSGASPSYFAMFLGQTRDTVPPRFARGGDVPPLPADALARLTPDQLVKHVDKEDWGRLQEARVVAADKGLETYEDIVRGNIDPALLEYASGNTFRGRVFPIPRKGYNRVLLAYEELLPVSGARSVYRFPLPDCKLHELQLTLQARTADCKDPAFRPEKAEKTESKFATTYRRSWEKEGSGGDAVFSFAPARPEVQAIAGQQGENGPHYVYARLRPDLKAEKAAAFAKHAVFLLDASLSESPDRFGVSVKLMRKILEADPDLERFNVLTFNVGAAWLDPKGWFENHPKVREKALGLLDGLVLEGATDFAAALETLARPGALLKDGTPVDVFVLSDGQITWGEGDVNTLVSRFEKRCGFPVRVHCYRTGLGAENLDLFEALTRRGGGIFNCFTDADLAAAARAHRQQCWQVNSVSVVDGPRAEDVLVAGRRAAVYPGGEIVVAARVGGTGRARIKLAGPYLGQRMTRTYDIDVSGASELAPRGWGEVAVHSMLALNDPALDTLVTAYCQQFGIGCRVASFLVLENDADFKRLNLETERGRTVPGDLGDFLARMWDELAQPLSPRATLERLLAHSNARTQVMDRGGAAIKDLLSWLSDDDFAVAAASLDGPLTRREDVPPAYRAALTEQRREASPFTTESRRRRTYDPVGAVRALSSIVEEHPGRGDALRLVGYRLLDLGQAGHAVRLFERVLRQRPFEPHSYRDLAHGLEACGKVGVAAVHYESVLAGTWHNRFGESLKAVVQEEYARMLRTALERKVVKGRLADYFARRRDELDAGRDKADLRVTITWNTDATDVDLWVVEPDGNKCYYGTPKTPSGELSQDLRQGYGPERYVAAKAQQGVYRVVVHYFSPNPNLLAGETHVQVVVTRFAGTPREVVERHTVILKKHNEEVEVVRVKF